MTSLPRLPRSGGPLQAFAMALITPYYSTAYRIRGWGGLPRRRGATLLISNHQHDLDTTAIIMRLAVRHSWIRPIYMVGSRRIFEPGFMEVRFAPIRWLVDLVDWEWMYGMLGTLPIENELRRRAIASLAYAVYRMHGDLPASAVFSERASHALRGAPTLKSLIGRPLLDEDQYVSVAVMNEPYRSQLIEETRRQIEGDLARVESVLRAGGTLYLTPEGKYTRDGRLNRFRKAFERLRPLGEVYLLALSYDVFAPGRLSLLYRVLEPRDPDDLRSSLAAARPVTVSQVLASWVIAREGTFTRDAALEAVRSTIAGLPSTAFVDPEISSRLERMVDGALASMSKAGYLVRESGGAYRLGERRYDKRFPLIPDIVVHQANFFAETAAACEALAARAPVPTAAAAPSSR